MAGRRAVPGLTLAGLAKGTQAGRRESKVGTALGLEVGRRGQLTAQLSQPHPMGAWLQVGN